LENERNGGSFLEGKILGIGEAVDFGAADKLGAATVDHVAEIGELWTVVVPAGEASRAFAAGDSGSEEDFLAGLGGGDTRVGFFDDPRDVAAGNVRKRDGNAGKPAADPQVEVVERAAADADEDFAGAEFGFGCVGVAEDFGTAVVVEEDGFHSSRSILACSATNVKKARDSKGATIIDTSRLRGIR
jgi:hypothetical protein